MSSEPQPDPQWSYIDTPAALQTLCTALQRQLETQPWLALDTEFIRERTYYPQLCLLQIGTAETIACVDPLALGDLGPLLAIIYDPRVTKVFHAAHQDLEIFYHLTGSVPTPVFDTQLAAPLLGHPNQAGYAVLVREILGITLNKGHARTDWSRRPLSEAQLGYAADDVRYLGQIYVRLRDRLRAEGRLDWLTDDFDRLSDTARYVCDPATAWKRIRASRRLRGKALAIVKSLAAWRETAARERDIPRNWVLRDELLCDLARLAPQNDAELRQIRGIGTKQFRSLETEILPLIRSALEQPVDKGGAPSATTRPTPEQDAVLDALMAVVHVQALQNNMHPSTLASRKDVERWLLDPNADNTLTKGWRRAMIGDHLAAMLAGRRQLRIHNHRLQLIDATEGDR